MPKITQVEVTALWDNGSTLSFITFKLAEKLRLQGKKANLSIQTVGGQTTSVESYQYSVNMIDLSGQRVEIEVLAIEKISSSISAVNIQDIASLFSVDSDSIKRPSSGEIDVLVGVQYAAYHPVRIEAKGHLLLLQTGLVRRLQGRILL